MCHGLRNEPLVIAVDFGTQGVKAMCLDTLGRIHASVYKEYPTLHPRDGWAEQDPKQWLEALKDVLKSMEASDPSAYTQVQAICVTGQMHGLVLLDPSLEPLGNCIIWADTRCINEMEELRCHSETILRASCSPLATAYSLPKMVWWTRNHDIDLVEHVLFPKDFINFYLTGKIVTDFSDASGSQFFDVHKGQWCERLVSLSGLKTRVLPEVLEAGTEIGTLLPGVARDLNLPEDTRVFLGAGDLATGLLGLGVSRPGRMGVLVGTSGQVMYLGDGVPPELLGKAYTFRSVQKDRFLFLASTASAGYCLKWMRDTIGEREVRKARLQATTAYEVLLEEAFGRPSMPSLIFLPYLMGTGSPHFDSRTRACFIGLGPEHQKADLIRSVVEGITYSLKDCIDLFGGACDIVTIGGGATRSARWNQLMADVFGVLVQTVHVADASCFGAGLLALVGLGFFTNLEDATEACIHPKDVFRPDKDEVAFHDKKLKKYREAYHSLQSWFAQ